MTFSEYFNGLYPYLSDGKKPIDFFDDMIFHFIHEDAQDTCKLLDVTKDTKRRYIQPRNPNKIKSEYAQYIYSKHNSEGYQDWLQEQMDKQDSFETIEDWLSNNDIEVYGACETCDSLLETIFFDIANPRNSDESTVIIPEKGSSDFNALSQLSENDRALLKEFQADFDSILEQCIASEHAEVWFTSKLSPKVNRLYDEKWKNKINDYEDISLKADTLNTLVALTDFCKALDPSTETLPGTSVHKFKIKLRDSYVKIHPDKHTDIFPYEAFIDEWDDGNEL